jgi:hypothetical protein
MSGRVFSVILLPTSECKVACDYCFEHKESHRLSPALLPLLTRRLLTLKAPCAKTYSSSAVLPQTIRFNEMPGYESRYPQS